MSKHDGFENCKDQEPSSDELGLDLCGGLFLPFTEMDEIEMLLFDVQNLLHRVGPLMRRMHDRKREEAKRQGEEAEEQREEAGSAHCSSDDRGSVEDTYIHGEGGFVSVDVLLSCGDMREAEGVPANSGV